MNVTAGAIVDFECMHRSFDVVWEVNGSMLDAGHLPPGVEVGRRSLGGGGFRHVITFSTSLNYDNTTFACVLEDDPSIRSAVALLGVQG